MARIRTIKPDALQHRKVGRLSDRAFRVWVGLLTQADDEGRLPCDPDQVAAWCFGYQRHVSLKQVEESIQEIESLKLICLYAANGTRYAYFPSWKDHQRIDKPQRSILPDPFAEQSENILGTFALEGKGLDRKGKEKAIVPRRNDVTLETAYECLIFPVKGGEEKTWELPDELFDEWQKLYPGMNILHELQKALAWTRSNPSRQKTAKGMPRFLLSWMARAQNSGKMITGRTK